MQKSIITREEWLNQATNWLRPIFEWLDNPIPIKIHLACGWPLDKNHEAECWHSAHSTGGFVEIFISPKLDSSFMVLEVLTHELIHATGLHGHSGQFKKIALALGLQGNLSIANADRHLAKRIRSIISQLGEYPHFKMVSHLTMGPHPKNQLSPAGSNPTSA